MQETECNDTQIELSDEEFFDHLRTSCEQRYLMYALLARLYRNEVDASAYEDLRHVKYPARTGNESLDEGSYLIAKYLSNAWPDPVLDLAKDYTRCFIGDGMDAHSAAYPFESVHTSKRRLMMQSARDEVLAIYRANGFEKSDSWHEGEDHIAVELEFMGALCQRAARELGKGDLDGAESALRAQNGFLNDHILHWVWMLVDGLKKIARTDLYLGLAYFTEGYLEVDREFLSGLLS